jgi:hypothetical protein
MANSISRQEVEEASLFLAVPKNLKQDLVNSQFLSNR